MKRYERKFEEKVLDIQLKLKLDKIYSEGKISNKDIQDIIKVKNLKLENIYAIYIKGTIEGSMALETAFIDFLYSEDEDEDVEVLSFRAFPELIGTRTLLNFWEINPRKPYNAQSKFEDIIDKSGYDSSDYTDNIIIYYSNPGKKNRKTFTLIPK